MSPKYLKNMKNFILCVVVLLAINCVGCKSSGSGDPKNVLSTFFDALEKKDITTAKKYATKESESMLGMIEMAMKMTPDSMRQRPYDKNNMEFGDATIVGDKATVPVKDKKSGETTNFTLKKEDGDWKVAFDKVTMTELGKEKMRGKKDRFNNIADSSKKMMQEMGKMTDSLKAILKTDSIK